MGPPPGIGSAAQGTHPGPGRQAFPVLLLRHTGGKNGKEGESYKLVKLRNWQVQKITAAPQFSSRGEDV